MFTNFITPSQEAQIDLLVGKMQGLAQALDHIANPPTEEPAPCRHLIVSVEENGKCVCSDCGDTIPW